MLCAHVRDLGLLNLRGEALLVARRFVILGEQLIQLVCPVSNVVLRVIQRELGILNLFFELCYSRIDRTLSVPQVQFLEELEEVMIEVFEECSVFILSWVNLCDEILEPAEA